MTFDEWKKQHNRTAAEARSDAEQMARASQTGQRTSETVKPDEAFETWKKQRQEILQYNHPNEMAQKTTDITLRNKQRDSGLVLPAQPAVNTQTDPNLMSRNASDITFRNQRRDAQTDAYQFQKEARYAESDEQKQEAGQKAIAAEERADRLESRISANRNAMDADAQRSAGQQRMESYMAYAGAKDFASESAYRSTKNGKPVSYTAFGQISETGYGDVLYDAINGDQEARRIQSAKDALSGGNTLYTTTHEGWYNLPKESVALFDYIYAKQGKDAAYQFLNDYADRGMTAPEAFGYGFMEGSGAASAAAAIGGAAAKISGNDKLESQNEAFYQEYQKQIASAREAYPAAFSGGSTVGDLALMAGASAAAGVAGGGVGEAITKAVGKFAKTQGGMNAARIIGKAAAGAMHGAAMMAGMSAIRNAGPTVTGGMSGGDYAREILRSGADGTAMFITSALLSVGGEKIIRSAGIDTAFSRYLKNLVSGGVGMSVPAVINYARNDDAQREKYVEAYTAMTGADADTAASMYDKAKLQQLGKQILSGFLFSALSSVGSTAREVEEGRERLEEVYDHLLQEYLKAANYTASSPEAQTEYLNDLRGILTQYIRIVEKSEFAGQQKYVNKLLDELYSLTAIEVGGNFVNTEPAKDSGLLMLVRAAVEPSVEPEAPSSLIAPAPAQPETPGVSEQAPVFSPETPVESPVSETQLPSTSVEAPDNAANESEPEAKPNVLPPVPEQKPEEIAEQPPETLPESPVLTEAPKDDTLETEPDTGHSYRSEEGYAISKTDTGSEISFDKKPSEDIRSALKKAGYKWNSKRKLWKGTLPADELREILEGVQPDSKTPAISEEGEHNADGNALTLPTVEETETASEEETLTLPAERTPASKPHEVLSDALLKKLNSGEAITREELQSLAADAYGGSRSTGIFDMKTAYDVLELAVNRYLMNADFVKNGNGNEASARMVEKRMQALLDRLPTQNVRTEEQVQYQQFSTPPNIAYLAAWLANISDTDSILEPSAGIGGLALWGKAWGARVYANELSQRRAEILRSLGLDEVFTENAEQIDNILPDRVKPTVVLMNPPFSSAAGRTTTNNTANAKRHVEQALSRLQDGGRLVAILGRGMANDSKTFAKWWDALRSEYNIRANLSINGDNYKKYGTTFDVQLVVIDKTGAQEDRSSTITGQVDDLLTVPDMLSEVRNDRQRTEAEDLLDLRDGDQLRTPSRPSGLEGSGSSGRSGRRSDGGVVGEAGRSVEPSGRGGRGLQPGRAGGDADGTGQRTGGGLRGEGSSVPERDSGERSPERNDRPVSLLSEESKEETPTAPKSDDGVYAEYVPPKTGISGAKKHPAKLVESAAMASVPAPAVSYKPNLPKELISSGALSDVQLTNIVYAGAAHSQMLPEQNVRKGYFIGDGTGVGKGRQIAGIIMDNMRQGRKKAVWISKNSNLYADAQRDWSDLGGDKQKVYSLGKVKVGDAIKPDDGIIFATYDTLASKSQKTKQSRIDQLVNWLGADFDGVIAFDEAHNLGNLLGKKGTFGKTSPSKKAIAGAEFQKRLPNARVVYVSATMATEVEGMAFADRLGLWGPGTQFKNVNDFVEKIGSGGLAAMELVARDMKAMGLYQARSISFDGVNYDTLTHQLTDVQTEIYDTMSRAWQITLQNIEAAMKSTNMDKNSSAKSAAKSAYYGAMQRFYNQVLTSMVMPSVVKDIQRQLDAGKSVVLQIVNTNEAATERGITAMEDNGKSPEDLDITPREALIGYLQNSFPVQEYEVFEDENGNKRSRPVVDSAGNPVLNRKAVAERDRLIAQIEQMSVPQGALDLLLDAFGVENVAEVTGRKRRVVKARGDDGNMTTIIEKRGKNSNDADVQAFQDGKKRILVFSDAGGTGKSYHADLRAKNQQQRVHYLLQPGWNAPNAVQGLGRTNRSNQANAPTYVLVTTNASGQKRFVSTIARRLDQLGAITKGQRQTGSGVFSAKDNLESDLARDALVNFYKSLIAGKLEGLDPNEILESLGLAKSIMGKDGKSGLNMQIASNTSTFLNRILSLEIEKQNAVFDAYNEILESMYQKAEEDGTLDKGMETVRADKVEVADEITVYTDPATGAETKYVQARAYTKTNPAKTLKELQGRAKDFIGLYRKKDGTVIGVFKAANSTDSIGRVVQNVKVLGPVSRGVWQTKTLEKQADPIAQADWDAAWAEEVERAPKFREETKHMLTGTLLPVWNKLPTSGNVRVQRLIADDGRQYLGRIIDPSMIDGVLRSLGVTKGRTKKTYSPEEVLRSVLEDGGKAILTDDRMTLTRRLVGGEQRIEITGDNLWSIQRRIPEIYTENIQSKWRYFIPNGDKQLDILKKLLSANPVSEVNGSAGRSTQYSKDVKALNGNQLQNRPDMWKTDRVGDREAKAMSLTDLVEKLRHEYKIPVNTGGLRAPDARAAYFTKPRSVRLKVTDDISDLAHELGHHLDNIYGIEDKIEKAAMEEAVSKMPEEFRNTYEPDELPGEAISEFVRRYLLNSATAKIDYPTFYDEFFNAVGSSETKTLAELADEFNAYYSLSAEQENYPIHNREDRGRDFRSFKEQVSDFNERFRMAILDITAPLERLDRETGGDSHMFAINSAYISNRISAALSTTGLYDMRGNKIGESLGTILQGVNLNNKAEYNALGMWLICKHGIEVLTDGHRVFANDAMNNEGYMQDEMKRIEAKYPKIDFEDIADRLYAFQDAVLQAYGVEGQLYTPEMVQEWRDKWKFYVPFYRWFGGKEGKNLKATKKGFANQTGHVRRLVGSGREFINPVDNIMESTARFMSEAILNDVMLHVADDVNKPKGLGWLMERFPAKMKRTTMDITDRKDSFLSGLIEKGLVDTDTYDQIADLLNNELEDILEQYSRGKEGGDTITVMRHGVPEVWKINDANLLKSITNMNAGMRSQVMGAIASATRFVSANITGRNIVWAVTSNSVRDLFTLLILGDFNHAGKLISGIVSGWANSFKGNNADDLFKEYIALGGGSTSSFTADRNMSKSIRKEVQPDKWHYLNPITYMSFLGDMIERGPRFATYRLYRLEKGATPEQAFYAAMESTVNFRRSGMYTKELGAVIPFFGASVQSVDRAERWLQADDIKDPKAKKRVSKGRISAWLGVSFAVAALTTLLNNSTKKRRKYYSYLSNYTKNSYFVIQGKDGKVLAIPKARELMIPISFFERVIERTVLGNKDAFDGFWEYVTDNTLPGVISGVAQGDWNSVVGDLSIIGGIHYLQSNQDFLGRPIVSAGLANLKKADQWNSTTSVPAKFLGQALNLSPQQLDFIGTNYFSFAWKPVKAVWNVGGNPDYTLGVKSQWIKDSLFSTDVVNTLYDARDEAEAAKNSDPGDQDKAVHWKLLDNTAKAYSTYYKLAKAEPETSKSRALRGSVLDSIIGAVGGESSDPAFRYMKDAVNVDTPGNIMPSVMSPEVKYKDGASGNSSTITLNAAEFWDYQTDYNAKYYNYLRSAMQSSDSAETKASVCKAAKDIALIMAKGKVIEAHGGSYGEYEELLDFVDGGGNPADFVRYKAAKNIVDDDGYNSTDAARVVAGLQLPDVYTQAFLLSQQSESLGNRFKTASRYGMDIDEFSLVLDAFEDTQHSWKSSGRSGESGWTQKAAEEAIDMIYGKTTIQNRSEKAAAWQSLNAQWTPKNNPYNQDVGREIVDTLETLKLPTE